MKPSAVSRRCAHHRATLGAGIPEYASDIRPVRGRCLKPRCRSRWAVVRVTLDFRADRIERFAATECAVCGHVWRRVSVPSITSREGYQAVRLTLILPSAVNRWFSRGTWHREGDDAVILREASIGDLDEAARAHRKRAERADARRARERERRAAADTAAHERTVALLARLAAMDAERAADEARD